MERRVGSAVMAEAHGTSRPNSSKLPARFSLCCSGTSVSLLQVDSAQVAELGCRKYFPRQASFGNLAVPGSSNI